MRKGYAAVYPFILDRSAPTVAHAHCQTFAEAAGRHDLVIDVEEKPFLLFRFHPLLHLLDGMSKITASATSAMFHISKLLFRFCFAVLRQSVLIFTKS